MRARCVGLRARARLPPLPVSLPLLVLTLSSLLSSMSLLQFLVVTIFVLFLLFIFCSWSDRMSPSCRVTPQWPTPTVCSALFCAFVVLFLRRCFLPPLHSTNHLCVLHAFIVAPHERKGLACTKLSVAPHAVHSLARALSPRGGRVPRPHPHPHTDSLPNFHLLQPSCPRMSRCPPRTPSKPPAAIARIEKTPSHPTQGDKSVAPRSISGIKALVCLPRRRRLLPTPSRIRFHAA